MLFYASLKQADCDIFQICAPLKQADCDIFQISVCSFVHH